MPEVTARLFSALLLPDEVVTSLRRELDNRGGPRAEQGLRWMPVEEWHITLGFYGLDDPRARAEWLRHRLAGSPPPTLRIDGSGTFRGYSGPGYTASVSPNWPRRSNRKKMIGSSGHT